MRADASSGQQLLKHACGHSRRQAVDSNHACSIKSQRLGCLLGLQGTFQGVLASSSRDEQAVTKTPVKGTMVQQSPMSKVSIALVRR